MKNFSIILNVVLGLSVLYLVFRDNPKQKNQNPPVAGQQIKPADCTEFCMDYTADPDYTLIQGAAVQSMALAYKRSHPNTPDDANSVWFELDALKKFIWNIEKSVCENNCNANSLNLGIRIYYAHYPQTGPGAPEPFNNLIPEYSGKHTVFMIPTYDLPGSTPTNDHFDFNINRPFANCTPDRINPDDTTSIGLFIPIGKNHGTLCPPYCNGAVFQ